jgi:uncharacterized membrane protein YvbJ
MVYCHNCGTKNEDDAEYCSKCGTPLKEDRGRRHRDRDRESRRNDCFGAPQGNRHRSECFGLPHGNIIVPLIIGVVLILAGLSSFYNFNFLQYFWPFIIVIIGILIILGAIYGARRRN